MAYFDLALQILGFFFQLSCLNIWFMYSIITLQFEGNGPLVEY